MIIGIDLGHTVSGPNTGAVGIINESEETRRVGNKVIEFLKRCGNTVINCTVDTASSNSASLNERVNKANAQPLDLFVSIHFNAGGGKGSEVFTYGGAKHIEAIRVLENLNEIGFINRGIKDGSNLAVIRGTKAKAMLIEVCFVDTQSDVDLYRENIDKIALAIADGIIGEKISHDTGNESHESEGIEMPDTLRSSACKESLIADKMIEQIKVLQEVVGLNKDGIGTYKLCKLLPQLKGGEQRGVVTIMQRILILKGMLSKGSDTGIIGDANKNAIKRFKDSVGITEMDILVDTLTWFKLIEY